MFSRFKKKKIVPTMNFGNCSVTIAEADPRLDDPEFKEFQKQQKIKAEKAAEKKALADEKEKIEVEAKAKKKFKVGTEVYFQCEANYDDEYSKGKIVQIIESTVERGLFSNGFFCALKVLVSFEDSFYECDSHKLILVDKKKK